jgi:hypothetical protein
MGGAPATAGTSAGDMQKLGRGLVCAQGTDRETIDNTRSKKHPQGGRDAGHEN